MVSTSKRKRGPNRMRALELKFRGLAIEDGVWETAEALARESGTEDPAPPRWRKDSSQFPFQTALAQHVRRMEARFGGILEAAPDAMVVANRSGGIVLINAQAETQFGYARTELLGEKLTRVLDAALAHELCEAGIGRLAETVGEQALTGIEATAIRSDGSRFPVEIMLSLVEGPEGPLVISAIRNISARKAAERQLVRHEERARALLDAAPDPMIVVNRRGRIVQVNLRAEEVFGYARDELLGKGIETVLPQGVLDRLTAYATLTPDKILAEHAGALVEVTAVRKDGTGFAAEMTLAPLGGSDGLLVTAAIRDLSGRTPLVDADAAPEYYRLLLDASPEAMIVVDPGGEIALLNAQAERRFGHLRHEVIGLSVTRLIPDGFAERLVANALRASEVALAQEIGKGIELTGLRKDGVRFPIEVMLSPFNGPRGLQIVATIRDMSVRLASEQAGTPSDADGDERFETLLRERRSLERRLRELVHANQDLQQFAFIAAHHLGEPLGALESALDGLSGELAGASADKARAFAGAANDGLRRMRALMSDLRAYDEIATSEVLVPIPVEEVIDEALGHLAGRLAESGAVVTRDVLPHVMGNRGQFVLLFENLLENAMIYRRAGPQRIHISVAPNKAGEWVFGIADKGIGIERPYFERIFQMFQRLHRYEEYPGTGIGLALCRRIAEHHDGRIWVESEPGIGSTFYLALPAQAVSP
jgi:PAS domain S-box-containing protein